MAFAQTASEAPHGGFIARWWQDWKSIRGSLAQLDRCGRDEIDRIAHDLSLTSGELRMLARNGANSARLLYRRMAELGLRPDKIAGAEPKVMRDLQKLCAMCDSKARCERDFARSAESSAWHAYCPNDDTLIALRAQAIKPANRVRAIPGSGVKHQRGPSHAAVWLWGMLLVWVWLIFDIDPRFADFHIPSLASLATETAEAPPAPPITCLDADCLSAPQQAALQAVRSVQEQGWINSSVDQLQSLPQAALDARIVHNGEALLCGKAGGTTYYGLIFHQGCSLDGVKAARLNGYNTCRPMTGGGVCFLN